MTDTVKRAFMKNIASAPMIYFDQAPTLGVVHNIVEVDLAARVLSVDVAGAVSQDYICVAHLRCSFEAAVNLRAALSRALNMAHYDVPADDGVPAADPSPRDAFARRLHDLQ